MHESFDVDSTETKRFLTARVRTILARVRCGRVSNYGDRLLLVVVDVWMFIP